MAGAPAAGFGYVDVAVSPASAGVTLCCRRNDGWQRTDVLIGRRGTCRQESCSTVAAWLIRRTTSSGSRRWPATRRARCWVLSNGSATPSRGLLWAGRCGYAGDRRRVDDDLGWAGQAPGADRGRLLLATCSVGTCDRCGRTPTSTTPIGSGTRPRTTRQNSCWRDAVTRSRVAVTAVLADGDLGQLVKFTDWDDAPSLRRVLVDLIEEYARHVGHADLIRESVDGLTGDDPPR